MIRICSVCGSMLVVYLSYDIMKILKCPCTVRGSPETPEKRQRKTEVEFSNDDVISGRWCPHGVLNCNFMNSWWTNDDTRETPTEC